MKGWIFLKKNLIFLLLILLVINLSACGSKKTKSSSTEGIVEAQEVWIAKVKSQQISQLSELSGVLKPYQETLISFEVSGRITTLIKKEGDYVNKGESLGILDAKNYQLGTRQASASAMQAKSGLQQVIKGAREQEINQAKATVEKAEAGYQKALNDFNRTKELYQEGAVSAATYEGALTGLNIAEQDLKLARESYSIVTQGATQEVRDGARAAYDQAIISKEAADLSLAKTKLHSPFNGTVISKFSSEGELVSAGMPIYKIGNIDKLKVLLPVPDWEIKSWAKGDKVTLSLYEETQEGEVVNIFPATNENTGTIGVEVIVTNPERLWFAGQVVTVTRPIENKKRIYVPVEAVISSGVDYPYVFRPVGKKARKTSVKVGQLVDNKFEILSGLKEGDEIIIKGADRLHEGQLIEKVRGN